MVFIRFSFTLTVLLLETSNPDYGLFVCVRLFNNINSNPWNLLFQVQQLHYFHAEFYLKHLFLLVLLRNYLFSFNLNQVFWLDHC